MVADLRKAMKLNRHNSLLKTGRTQESLAEHQAMFDSSCLQVYIPIGMRGVCSS
jgi:hypothetical protein